MIKVNVSYTIKGQTPEDVDFIIPDKAFTDSGDLYLFPTKNHSEPIEFFSSDPSIAEVTLIDSTWKLKYLSEGFVDIVAKKGLLEFPKNIEVINKPPIGRTVNVGSGSGSLNITQTGSSLEIGDTVIIKAGTYNSISLQQLEGVRIITDGLVKITGGGSKWNNLKNVQVDGSYVNGIKYSIIFDTGANTAIESELVNDCIFNNIHFTDIESYSTWLFNNPLIYAGTEATYLKGCSFRNLKFNNCTPIRFEGSLDTSRTDKLIGLIVDFIFSDIESYDCLESIIEIGACHNLLIEKVVANNSNQSRENHAVLFMVNGNCTLRHSKVTNFYGNIIRLWGFTIVDGVISTQPKLSKIYGNIGFCSRTYSTFELQNFSINRLEGFSTHTDLDIFNNTAGDLNLALPVYFTGTLLDNYDKLGATIRAFNNILFNKHGDTGNVPYFIWHAEVGEEFNNLYYDTSELSKLDLGNFTLSNISEAKGTAIGDDTMADYTVDLYGIPYSNNIGAVQRISLLVPNTDIPTTPINDLHTQGATYQPDKMLRARASQSGVGIKNYDVEINGNILTTRGGYAHSGRENRNSTGAYNFPIGPLAVRYRARDFRGQVSEWSEMLNVIIE